MELCLLYRSPGPNKILIAYASFESSKHLTNSSHLRGASIPSRPTTTNMAIMQPSTFRTLLAQYDSTHHHRHAAKPAPHNTCDCAFRFTTAPALVASRRQQQQQQQNDSSSTNASTNANSNAKADAKADVDSPAGYLTVDELTRLVEWKIAHGSFFPALPKLARGNGDEAVRRVTGEAFALLLLGTSSPSSSSSTSTSSSSADRKVKGNGDSPPPPATVMAALTTLTTLKGVGPATASLLLSVADGGLSIPFFADELFLWARARFEECGELPSKKSVKIRYDSKEYEELLGATRGFLGRMGKGEGEEEEVTAMQVEMVARVLGAVERGRGKEADKIKDKGKEKEKNRGKGGVDTVVVPEQEEDNTATKKANNAEPPQKKRKRGAAEAKPEEPPPAGVETKASATGRRVMPRRAAARKSRAVGI
ncbi:hypothetical protein IWZ01DRAFT_554287 [Phyllosticta capitalensis]